jgi:hypothetical protein
VWWLTLVGSLGWLGWLTRRWVADAAPDKPTD